jgi:hypothetical protein
MFDSFHFLNCSSLFHTELISSCSSPCQNILLYLLLEVSYAGILSLLDDILRNFPNFQKPSQPQRLACLWCSYIYVSVHYTVKTMSYSCHNFRMKGYVWLLFTDQCCFIRLGCSYCVANKTGILESEYPF